MHCVTYVVVVPCFVFPEPFTNEVIAVLNSQHRVIWKVESDRQISNEVRHYFWVRTGVILQYLPYILELEQVSNVSGVATLS